MRDCLAMLALGFGIAGLGFWAFGARGDATTAMLAGILCVGLAMEWR